MKAGKWPFGGAFVLLLLCAYCVGLWRAADRGSDTERVEAASAVCADSGSEYVGFDPLSVDLGAVPWSSEVAFELRFVNRSGGTVRISALDTCCGCLVLDSAAYRGLSVRPRESVSIAGLVEVGEHRGIAQKEIKLLLEDGSLHIAEVSYEVVQTYACIPTELDFGEVSLDAPDVESIRFAVFRSKTASIVAPPECDSPWLEAAAHEGASGETRIAVRVAADNLPFGSNLGRVQVLTDDPTRPVFSIAVRAAGVAALRPIPPHAFVHSEERKLVRFVLRDGTAPDLVEAVVSSPVFASTLLGGGLVEVLLVAPASEPVTAPLTVRDSEGNRSLVLVTFVP